MHGDRDKPEQHTGELVSHRDWQRDDQFRWVVYGAGDCADKQYHHDHGNLSSASELNCYRERNHRAESRLRSAPLACADPSTQLSSPTVSSGNQLDCTAFSAVSNSTTVPVNWTISTTDSLGGNIGSISAQGIYVAPLVPPPGQKVTVTATSQSLATDTMSVVVTVVYGNNVLSGPYVFSTSGRLTNSSNSFWARVGSFTAGGGTLTGIEDTNQGGTPNTVSTQRTFTGSYSIGTDGRGTMQFCEGSASACPQGAPATAYFRVAVMSQAACPAQPASCPPQPAQIIEFSSPATASASITAGGEMLPQDPTVFNTNNGLPLAGAYSFNFSGVSTAGTEESVVGDFFANGHGTINAGSTVAPLAPGEIDIDAGGAQTLSSSAYQYSSNGRGTVTLNGLSFSFYMASANRAKFIEIDSPTPPATAPDSILAGDAYGQQSSVTCGWGLNALSGLTVLETSGASAGVVISDLGSFTATNGVVTSASIDENSGGTVSSQVGTLNGSYNMDPCGRGTLTVGTHSYVFYIVSASDAVLQETTSGVVAHGLLVPSQGGPFVDTTLSGNFALRFGGTDAAGTAGHREDFLGQVTSAGSGTGLAGNLDLNDFGTTQTSIAISNGTYLPSPAGSLRATIALSSNRNLVLYMVSPTLFYVLDTDPAPAGTALGAIYKQF